MKNIFTKADVLNLIKESVKEHFSTTSELKINLNENVAPGEKMNLINQKFKEQKLRSELNKIGPDYAFKLRELYDLTNNQNYLTSLKEFAALHNKAIEKTPEPKKEIENPKMFEEKNVDECECGGECEVKSTNSDDKQELIMTRTFAPTITT